MIRPYAFICMIKKDEKVSVVGGEATAKLICDIVCDYFEISFEDMITRTKTQKNNFLKARQIATYFIREKTSLKLKEIGKLLGGFDHTTVISNINLVKNLLDTEESYRKQIEQIKFHLQINCIDNDTRIAQIKKQTTNNNNHASSR